MMPSFLTPLLLRRSALSALLLADVLYAAFAAPKGDPPGNLFVSLALGQGPARNPAVWGVFQLLGIVPLMYWALLFPDGRGQRVWAWPFALGMMALGALALLPYLILRRPYPDPAPGPPAGSGAAPSPCSSASPWPPCSRLSPRRGTWPATSPGSGARTSSTS